MKHKVLLFCLMFNIFSLTNAQFLEDFENGIPEGWAQEINGPGEWTADDDMWLGLLLPSKSLVFDDDINGMDADPSVAMITLPQIDLSNFSNASLSFDIGNYVLFEEPTISIRVFFEDEWIEIYNKSGQFPLLEEEDILVSESINISAYLSPAFQLQILYDDAGDWAFGMAIDNIRIEDNLNVLDVLSSSRLSIYPNPVSDAFNIKLSKDFDLNNTKVSIFDLTGKKHKTFNYLLDEYNISNLPNGVYILVVSDGKNSLSKKLIKQ